MISFSSKAPMGNRFRGRIMDITLTSAVRNNVLTLQMIGDQQSVIQNRLSTGKKVNSALDDPRNFFQASSLNNRANDLGRRLDGMGLAIKTIEAADKGITALTRIAENMAAVSKQAADSNSAAERATLLAQFNELRTQMINVARDSGFNGTNLLAAQNLTVAFNEDATSTMSVTAVSWVAADPAGVPAGADWGDADLAVGAAAIATSATAVNNAIGSLRTQAAAFGTSLTTVKVREEFTKGMMNTLKGGADGLVLADQNEEAANLLALNTRQQLSQQALSLAAQSEQSILRLFG
ncbi:MAG: flagellin [Salinarimonadaceae bacterium]|nr:MAG: flagellin [Salinarimonadaceae bacterium]